MTNASTPASASGERTTSSAGIRIAVAWALVGIPLIYGIAMTLTRVAALFTG